MVVGFDTTVLPKLDYRDPERFWQIVRGLDLLFRERQDQLAPVMDLAPALEAAYQRLDPLIQEYTAKVCPYCGTICCANKFGFPEFGDVVVFLSLGLDIPKYRLDINYEEICQFIGEKGCVLSRPNRPYRCTWYFCDPLLVQLEIGPAIHYRNFIKDLQELSRARGELLKLFHEIWTGNGWDLSWLIRIAIDSLSGITPIPAQHKGGDG